MIAVDLLVALPLLGALVTAVSGRFSTTAPRAVALVSTFAFAACLLSLAPYGLLDGVVIPGAEGPSFGVPFWEVRIDGVSAPLLLLVALLGPVVVLASWGVASGSARHHALLLTVQAATAGVFIASDIVLFYVFWEAVLIPLFFLIGGWGYEGGKRAALKFVLYTFAGGAIMLVGITLAVFQTGHTSFDALLTSSLEFVHEPVLFWLILLGMLVKIPVVPLHTWLADAHVQAPTAGSILLAGLLLKMGGYGVLRIALPLSPETFEAARPALAVLGVVGIVYGAALALAQVDLKRLVALSSVSHMGFVVLAISTGSDRGFKAAILVMIAHGLVAPLLFLLVGQLSQRTGTRDLSALGGLGAIVPRWGAAFTLAALASAGVPGLASFPGEMLAITSSFESWSFAAAPALAGLALAAAYNLRAVRGVLHGARSAAFDSISDLSWYELLPVAALCAAIIALGMWPRFVLDISESGLGALARLLGGA